MVGLQNGESVGRVIYVSVMLILVLVGWFVHSFVYSHICGPVLMDHPQIIAYGVSNGHVIEVFDGGLAEVYTLLVFCLVIYIKKYTLRTDESTSDQRPHIWENSNGHISP